MFGKLDKKESTRGHQMIRREDDMKIPDLFKNGDTNSDLDTKENEQDEGGWVTVQSKNRGSNDCSFLCCASIL